MRYNTQFGNVKNSILEYAPETLRLVIHHHDEGDYEKIIWHDPTTGEVIEDPEDTEGLSAETVIEHWTNDWDTYETKLDPSPEDYYSMNWRRILDKFPEEVPQDGHHWEARNWYNSLEDDYLVLKEYVQVENPPPPPRTFRRSYLAQWIKSKGKWNLFEMFLGSSEEISFLWTYSTEFDEDNPLWPTALGALREVLSLTDEEVNEMLKFGEGGTLE